MAIIPALGEFGLEAVTTNLNINFLAEPKPRDLLAEVRRISRPAAAGEVVIVSEAVPTRGGPLRWPPAQGEIR